MGLNTMLRPVRLRQNRGRPARPRPTIAARFLGSLAQHIFLFASSSKASKANKRNADLERRMMTMMTFREGVSKAATTFFWLLKKELGKCPCVAMGKTKVLTNKIKENTFDPHEN
jgi:hypothetical protein